MSRIHYFQRYSSAENTVTNNTLLLLARIYEYSPERASILLSDLTGEAIQIGIEVSQQQRARTSVPDGAIIQRSFKILIEAKVEAGSNLEQLKRHADAFDNESQKVLLLLTRQHEQQLAQEFASSLKTTRPEVIFKNLTYEEICKAVQSLFREHETGMLALVEDYIEYCNDANLFDQTKYLMRVVPCSTSININLRFSLYFHPSDRGYTAHRFIGIYADKAVRAVLEPTSVFDISFVDGKLDKAVVEGPDTSKFDDALKSAIEAAKVECGYDIRTGHRFFCGNIAETEFPKTSLHGIQGPRLLNLIDYIDKPKSLDSVANLLRSSNWK